MPGRKAVNLESDDVVRLLREIDKTPEMTQRELSARMGISLGKVNFLIKALIEISLIKANNFKNANNKLSYVYILTPSGMEEKARITCRFLRRKIREYEELEKEIGLLKNEIKENGTEDDLRPQYRAEEASR